LNHTQAIRISAVADNREIDAALVMNGWAWNRWIVKQKDVIEFVRPWLQNQRGQLAKQISRLRMAIQLEIIKSLIA
jgi:hypothetical protein